MLTLLMLYPKTNSFTAADASSQMSVANETVLGCTEKTTNFDTKKTCILISWKKHAKPQLKGAFEKNTKKRCGKKSVDTRQLSAIDL